MNRSSLKAQNFEQNTHQEAGTSGCVSHGSLALYSQLQAGDRSRKNRNCSVKYRRVSPAPAAQLVWRSLPTVKSRAASITITPFDITCTTRPARLNCRLELIVEAPFPSRAVAEFAAKQVLHGVVRAYICPRSPVIADWVLNCRDVAFSPLVAAENVSTRLTTIKSPGRCAL